jgi:hypothetical protein
MSDVTDGVRTAERFFEGHATPLAISRNSNCYRRDRPDHRADVAQPDRVRATPRVRLAVDSGDVAATSSG